MIKPWENGYNPWFNKENRLIPPYLKTNPPNLSNQQSMELVSKHERLFPYKSPMMVKQIPHAILMSLVVWVLLFES